MLISSKSEYGLRALIDIAVHGNGQLVSRSDIARRQQIPLPFLTQVLRCLVNGGLLKSSRGPAGGYVLSKAPADISLLEVINILQGPVAPTNCAGLNETKECSRLKGCGLAGVWSKLQSVSEEVLSKTSLEAVIKSSRETNNPPETTEITPDKKLDCIGETCPLPIVKIAHKMRNLKPRQVLEVWADDEGSKADIPAWCMGTGNEFLGREKFGRQMKFLIRKGRSQGMNVDEGNGTPALQP
jgi:Rrf2 family protein